MKLILMHMLRILMMGTASFLEKTWLSTSDDDEEFKMGVS